jgi:crossover junction endodeoxyribonuclease RusA
MTPTPIRFPWPNSRLSPNKRVQHRYATAERGQAREIGFWLTKDAGIRFDQDDTLQLTIKICPPDRRGRDDDNIYSCFKAYRDGIFSALDMNDKKIRRTILEWGEVEKGGALYVTLERLEK